MTLEDRVVQLERQNRGFRRLGLAAALAAAVFVLTGASPQGVRRIDVNEIFLRDSAGRERAALLVTKEGAVGVWLRDATGKFRSVYSLGSTGSAIIDFRDKNGKVRMAMGVTQADSPRINIVDANGKLTKTFR